MAASTNRNMLAILAVSVIAIVLFIMLTLPDRRSPTERVGDAISDLDKGPEKAARQLERRTPGEKLGDAIKDATAPTNQ